MQNEPRLKMLSTARAFSATTMTICSDLHLKSARPAFTPDFQPRLTATESGHRLTIAENEPAFTQHRLRLADRQPTIPASETLGCWVPQNVRFLDAL
ncbi:TPA: hypothetical protein U5E43_003650 [Yersinia enterocolitica]|nr:hypothetical protein [Yersinia enterocolitica]